MIPKKEKLIHFDWAMKKLLRHKTNFGILEGFLSELLKFDIQIENILESESNQDDEADKFNRVDILAKNKKGELLLIEVQNNPEMDYFHRMLYGVSKLVTEYISLGDPYRAIKKVYSINIVYFQLGQGSDYIYEYQGEFVGLNNQEILQPTLYQKNTFRIQKLSDIYPKYYLLKVNNFNDVSKNTLDEWIYFLKNSEIVENVNAKGLEEAQEKLRYEQLSPVEKKRYESFQKNKVIAENVEFTIRTEAHATGLAEGKAKGLVEGLAEGKAEGKAEGILEIAKKSLRKGMEIQLIAEVTGLSISELTTLKKELGLS